MPRKETQTIENRIAFISSQCFYSGSVDPFVALQLLFAIGIITL
jgi:hypothetical protein